MATGHVGEFFVIAKDDAARPVAIPQTGMGLNCNVAPPGIVQNLMQGRHHDLAASAAVRRHF